MPIVDVVDLQGEAEREGYRLPLFEVPDLAAAQGVLEAATEGDAPLLLAVSAAEEMAMLLPSLEQMARSAAPPVVLLARHILSEKQAELAIRHGCNGLMLAAEVDAKALVRIPELARDCGIPVLAEDGALFADTELESVILAAANAGANSWRQLEARISQTAATHAQALLEQSGALGKGGAALKAAAPWRPVEHLILYNTTVDDAKTRELAAKGRAVLDKIPGVRATWTGEAIKEGAGYRWCWLVRFANLAVIDSYREHPDHVAYADNHFRPIAGDRVSIDYELVGVEENPGQG